MVNQYPQYYQNYPNYQQQYQQPMQVIQQPIQQNIPNQILAWVENEEEAVKYPLPIGQSLFLMNRTDDYLYMKSVDQLGKTTFIKKKLVDESDNSNDLKEYIRKEELENLLTDKIQKVEDYISDRIQKEIDKKMSQITLKPAKKKVIVEDDEE